MDSKYGVPKISMSDLILGKKIGSGAFSNVYLMTWKRSQGDLEVASKSLTAPDSHELDILSTLDHPSIIKLLAYVDEGINFLLVLELCEGGSLRNYLDKHKLSEEQFYEWANQAAIPIEYLKKKNIVHKDVKSPNYLITRDDNLKLADFGLAKKIERTISNATDRASFPWMAPELFTVGKLSPNYDIFALAVVLWELRTSMTPFKGLEFQVIAWRVCTQNERLTIPSDMPQPIAELLRESWDADWKIRPTIEHILLVIRKIATAAKEEAAATMAAAVAAEANALKIWQQQNIKIGSWVLEKRFGIEAPGRVGYVHDIVVNSTDGNIAVLGYPTTNVFNKSGKNRFSIDMTRAMMASVPHQIAVSLDGSTYFITNRTEIVYMWDRKGKSKGQFVFQQPQPSARGPELWGLAINSKGQVLLGDCRSYHINVNEQDGANVARIKVGIAPKYLAVTSQDTILVAEDCKPSQIVCNKGRVLHILKHPIDDIQWQCQGVYCNTDRDILFISNINKSHAWEILCYNVSGQYLDSLPIPNTSIATSCAMMANGIKIFVCQYGTCAIYSWKK